MRWVIKVTSRPLHTLERPATHNDEDSIFVTTTSPKCSSLARGYIRLKRKIDRRLVGVKCKSWRETWMGTVKWLGNAQFTAAVLITIGNITSRLTFWRWNYFFLILAHPVYKMWIKQEPNTLELWNRLHFEERKNGEYIPRLKYSVPVFVE